MGQHLLIGTRKGLLIAERNGRSWQLTGESFLGQQVPAALYDARDGTLYAALNMGHFGNKVHRSGDFGKTWAEVATPAYPEKPADVPDIIDPIRQKAIPWSLNMIWSLETGGPKQKGTIWCGTLPGGLFRSDNRGDSWELNRPLWDVPNRSKWFGGGYDLPGIHSICVDPRNENHMLLAISCGGVWSTEDGGKKWENRSKGMRAEYMPPEQAYDTDTQDPHIMVRCPGAPDHLWVQHHNGIFRTTNNARQWSEIENVKPSGFGFAVAVHPKKPETAWFVPAVKDETRVPVDGKLVVNRTRDGGKTFEQLSIGLPPKPCYDLVYRHALAIDDSGDKLAFGSTTGGLWTSEDGGDSWNLLSAHLPPIFTVRFVNR